MWRRLRRQTFREGIAIALARTKVWVAAEVLFASDLNAEFNSVLNNALSLISPLTGNLDFNFTQAVQFRAENLSATPTAAAARAGRLYFQTTLDVTQIDDGGIIRTVWEGAQGPYHAEVFG